MTPPRRSRSANASEYSEYPTYPLLGYDRMRVLSCMLQTSPSRLSRRPHERTTGQTGGGAIRGETCGTPGILLSLSPPPLLMIRCDVVAQNVDSIGTMLCKYDEFVRGDDDKLWRLVGAASSSRLPPPPPMQQVGYRPQHMYQPMVMMSAQSPASSYGSLESGQSPASVPRAPPPMPPQGWGQQQYVRGGSAFNAEVDQILGL